MTETEFLALAQETMRTIEMRLEYAADAVGLDVDSTFSGNVLEIEFVGLRSKIIVNSQAPLQQIWVAAASGGFHFFRKDNMWVDTRDGTELFAALSRLASSQAGVALDLIGSHS